MPHRQNCPACDSGEIGRFLEFTQVPVHQNLLFHERKAAREATRGDIALTACDRCGFVFNAAFDAGLLDYGADYDNCQAASAYFNTHREVIGRSLAASAGDGPGTIIEVGCGNGDFLQDVVATSLPGWIGIGLDPAYKGPRMALQGRIEYRADFFPGSHPSPAADIVFSRHVIEHVPNPFEFVSLMADGLKPRGDSRLAIETPCILWTFTNDAFWDVTYEHCSLFSSGSLSALLARAGCETLGIEHVFRGQYLFATSRRGRGPQACGAPFVPRDWRAMLERFASRCRSRIAEQQAFLRAEGLHGGVAVWGAAGKGTMFCNWLDPDGTIIHRVLDNNPNKWGKYLCGTGHPIEQPASDSLRSTRLVIVMNSNYLEEITAQARSLNPRVMIATAESLTA
jgi:hypothetical protein